MDAGPTVRVETGRFALLLAASVSFSFVAFVPEDREMRKSMIVVLALMGLVVGIVGCKKDEPEVRHLGPMAEDFHAVFGLGEDDTSIAPADLAGVALTAIQAQQLQIEQQRQELSEKDGQIADLQTRLAAIEKRLTE